MKEMKMYKRVLAALLMGTMFAISVMGVSAAGSRTNDIYVSGDDKEDFKVVTGEDAFEDLKEGNQEVYDKIVEYNKDKNLDELLDGVEDVKKELEDKTLIWEIFEIEPIGPQEPNENGKYEVELTVTTLTNYSDDISVLVYNSEDGTWEVIKPKSVDYKNKKIVIEVSDLSVVGIYAKVATSKPEGTAPSTENTSSVWMLWVAVAVVAMGVSVIASQKKRG